MAGATDERLLRVADVARLLGVTEPTIRVWIKDGKLRAQRAGARFWRIRQSEVDRMLSAQDRPPPSIGTSEVTHQDRIGEEFDLDAEVVLGVHPTSHELRVEVLHGRVETRRPLRGGLLRCRGRRVHRAPAVSIGRWWDAWARSDTYAHCADRRDAEGQKSLFTEAPCSSSTGGAGSEPTYALDGREALTPVFDDLTRSQATMHFNGQSTVTLDGDGATGESYCIAHHLFTDGGERKLMVAWLRYGRHTRSDARVHTPTYAPLRSTPSLPIPPVARVSRGSRSRCAASRSSTPRSR